MKKIIAFSLLAFCVLQSTSLDAKKSMVEKVLRSHWGMLKLGVGSMLTCASFSCLISSPCVTLGGPIAGCHPNARCGCAGLIVGPAMFAVSFPLGHIGFKLMKSGWTDVFNYDEEHASHVTVQVRNN